MTAPQLRRDPITGRAVLVAPERAARAGAFFPPAEFPDDAADCPFCAGREERTPPSLFELPGNGVWRTRVVPNQFPAVREPLGIAEVIVERPDHATDVADWLAVLLTYQQRLKARREEGRWQYGLVFKNHGLNAGASLSHAHAQFIALPAVPPNVAAELPACVGGCRFCDLIASESMADARVVRATDRYIAFVAIAGRFPYETWILPRKHERAFEDADLHELADLLGDALARLDAVLGRPAWNLVIHTAPWTGADFHWHIEILPRVAGIAGFELGAGMNINPVLPEDAARFLQSPPVATGGL
ncbi:MAG: DUF4921 family protein [Gemmataceae bacterium]|nr:DUF4921 family protein [Gemmataceae bacterium]